MVVSLVFLCFVFVFSCCLFLFCVFSGFCVLFSLSLGRFWVVWFSCLLCSLFSFVLALLFGVTLSFYNSELSMIVLRNVSVLVLCLSCFNLRGKRVLGLQYIFFLFLVNIYHVVSVQNFVMTIFCG